MSDINKDQIKKILTTLTQAKSPVPLGYISLHLGIKEPLKILEKMEKIGLVIRSPCSRWSSCMEPRFEIVLPEKKESAKTVTVNGTYEQDD